MRRLVSLAVFLPLSAALAGCGDSYDGRQAVSGTVTLEGQPLTGGSIQFGPLDGQDTSGGCGLGPDGTFRLDRADGLKPGRYLVRITAGDGKSPASEEEVAAPGGSTNIVSVDRIPPEWNVRSDKQIEVKEGADNTFDFAVPKAYESKAKGKKKK